MKRQRRDRGRFQSLETIYRSPHGALRNEVLGEQRRLRDSDRGMKEPEEERRRKGHAACTTDRYLDRVYELAGRLVDTKFINNQVAWSLDLEEIKDEIKRT